jgi:hypothetical protein
VAGNDESPATTFEVSDSVEPSATQKFDAGILLSPAAASVASALLPDMSATVEDFLWSAAYASGEPETASPDEARAGMAFAFADPFAEDWPCW